jgi:diguanylate cyclase (GGDEF)-like protein
MAGDGARKLEPMNNELLEQFAELESFARVFLDAYALLDATGKVVKSNQLLNSLLGNKSTRQILKANRFDELITFHIDKTEITLDEILKATTHQRLDQVRGDNKLDPNMKLVLGTYPFFSENNKAEPIGTFVTIRDNTAEDGMTKKFKDQGAKMIEDPLTKLFTRGFFEGHLNEQMKAMTKLSAEHDLRNMTLALFDVDHFKKVNDTYGHQAGDHVLRMVGQACKQNFRKSDICCRYGGEEILIILPTTTLDEAIGPVEKFREAISKLEIVHDGRAIPITISGGIAQIIVDTESWEQTVGRADEALYAAKKGGRNQVQLHSGSDIRLVKK